MHGPKREAGKDDVDRGPVLFGKRKKIKSFSPFHFSSPVIGSVNKKPP